MNPALLSIRDLCVEFPLSTGTVHAVRRVSLDVARGECVGLVGESGCGKTMTALSIMGLVPAPGRATAGQILLEDRDLRTMTEKELRGIRGNRIAMVFQDPMTSLNPVLRVGDQIEEALSSHGRRDRATVHRSALDLLSRVEVPDPERRARDYPFQFSGGMRQRAVTAMGLANGPSLLIADEPTTALDVTVQAQVIELFRELNAERGMALLLITHNMALVSSLCSRMIVMYAGEVVESGLTHEVLRRPQHPYTRMLTRAVPRLETPRTRRLVTIDGAPPELDQLPTGCSFRPRCPYAIEKCAVDAHVIADVAPGHAVRCWVAMDGGLADIPAAPGSETRHDLRPSTLAPMVRVVDVGKEYFVSSGTRNRAILHAVDNVSFSILPGETLGLVGESGSGKSTLARLILRLERPTRGQVIVQDHDLSAIRADALRGLRKHMQIVFQDPYGSLDPRFTATEIIAEPLRNFGMSGALVQQRVEEVMNLCGLSQTFANRYAHEFSGGQRQRIAIARAIALGPALIVADEPVSALDVSIQAQVINLLRDLQAELSLTYLFISHDLSVVRHISDRVAVMYLGSLVEIGPVQAVYDAPLHPYTWTLLGAVPLVDPDAEARRSRVRPRGEIPSPVHPPSGCRFHPRCPWAQMPLCSTVRPDLRDVGDGRTVACHFPLTPGSVSPDAVAAPSTRSAEPSPP